MDVIERILDISPKHQITKVLLDFHPFIHKLQFTDEKTIRNTCGILRELISNHSKKYSPSIYNTYKIITKNDLSNKNAWYINKYNTLKTKTGGTTTGHQFEYQIWKDIYQIIEGETHYKSIIDEYNLSNINSVLYLMLDQHTTQHQFAAEYKTDNVLISHGLRKTVTIHDIIRNENYKNNYFLFYENLFKYCSLYNIDIILAPGNIIDEITYNIKRLKYRNRLCRFISSTGHKTNHKNLEFLVENGNINDWCDHMRCWDGGTTFFTCKYRIKHLLDGLSWVRSDDGRLISDDYYSISAPFINYWNGDYTTIENTYKTCKCGRLYRPFEITRNRTNSINGTTNTAIKETIINSSIDTKTITRIAHIDDMIRIFTPQSLSPSTKNTLRKYLKQFKVNFITEENYDE